MTHMFRVQEVRTWRPAVYSGTEELIRSLRTSQARGMLSSSDMAYLKNIQPYTIALCMVFISESLAYLNHMFLLIALLLISRLQNVKKLWRKNFIKGGTLALSHKQSSNLSLVLSNHPPSPLFLNRENQENSVRCMISPAHANHPQTQSHPSIQPLTHMTFPAHGEPSQPYPSLFSVCHLDHRPPFEMSLKHIGPCLVVCLCEDDSFAANICNNFGLTSAGGTHGLLVDAGTDIFRANGIGPLSKWVDDYIFSRIPRGHLNTYIQQPTPFLEPAGHVKWGTNT